MNAINDLVNSNDADLKDYLAKRQAHEEANNKKIARSLLFT